VNVNIQDAQGETPIQSSCERGDVGIVRKLLEVKAELKQAGDVGEISILMKVASVNGRSNVIKVLLEQGLKPSIQGFTLACSNGHYEAITVLLDADPGLISQKLKGEKGLTVAVKMNQKDTVLVLLDRDADPNTLMKSGKRTVLMEAIWNNSGDIIETLLEKKADLSLKDSTGSTALHKCINILDEDIIKMLLENKADPLIKDNDGNDCFKMYADHPGIIELLNEYVENAHQLKITDDPSLNRVEVIL